MDTPAPGNEQPSSSPADDSALLTALRARSEAGYERLLREQGGRMLATALRIMGHEDDARDALQDALLSVVKSIGQFDGNSRLSTWLHRIVVNACLMRLRSRRRKPEASIEDLLPRFDGTGHRLHAGPDWNPPPESGIERDRLREVLRDAMDRLPESYREVLVLRDVEELDAEATARALELTPGAVKTRLHRARQALRSLLEQRLAGTASTRQAAGAPRRTGAGP